MKQWQGQCHCGFIDFSVSAEIDHVRVCNCSVCQIRGALMFRVAKPALILRTALNDLRVYIWGSGTARDYFCPECGILTFRQPSALSNVERLQGAPPFAGWAINTRCLIGFDPSLVSHRKINGRQL